jgi:SagB-type dehydrogenase family enzyme
MKKITNDNIILNNLKNFDQPKSDCEKIHQKMKLKHIKNEVLMNPKTFPKEWKTIEFKGYPRFEEIKLPKPKLNKKITLENSLLKRTSVRQFQQYKVSLQEISTLLYYSLGIKNVKSSSSSRFYPSAGARYPIEIYVLSLNTELPPGTYHYFIKNHSLEKLQENKQFSVQKYILQKEFKTASFFIVMTGLFSRSYIKYGPRAYPFTLIEAGHIGQNIYLVSSGTGLATCGIEGFNNFELDKLLDIDGVNESSLYVFAVGKEKT